MLKEGFSNEVRQAVYEELGEMLAERGKPAELQDEMNLSSALGLSSLDLAELVAVLEQRLRRSPFRSEVAITSVRSVGDLCAAFSGGEAARQLGENARLARAMERGQGRRSARSGS